MKVLISDGDERSALAAARSLAAVAEIHVLADGPGSLAGASRSVLREHVVPDALADPDGFCRAVSALVEREAIDAVLPVTDKACTALLEPVPDRARPEAAVLAPSWEPYQRLSDKHALAELAARHGIDLPRGERVESEAAAVEAAERLGWPAVLKPVQSVSASRGQDADAPARKAAVRTTADVDALQEAWREEVGPGGAALVQECVPGWGEGLFLLRAGGRTRAAFAHRRLREKPPSGGVSVLRESIAVDPTLQARVEAVLDEAGLDGLAMAEFKTDGTSLWLMEFNVRLWGSLQLAIDAGVDFPRLLLASHLGEAMSEPPTPTLGVRSRWLLGDLDHALALARGRADTHGRRGLGAALGVLLRPAGPACRFEVLRSGDPRPFGVELRRWLRALRSS